MNISSNMGFEKIVRNKVKIMTPKKKAKGLSAHRKGYVDKRECSALH